MKKISIILISVFIIGSVLLSCDQQVPENNPPTKETTQQDTQVKDTKTETEKKDSETKKTDTESEKQKTETEKKTEVEKTDTESEKQKTENTDKKTDLETEKQTTETDKTETDKTEKEPTAEAPKQQKIYGVKFDFSNAKAIAKLESSSGTQRAVTNADELGDLVKILADGSMENAVTVDKNCSLSNIVAIYKSP